MRAPLLQTSPVSLSGRPLGVLSVWSPAFSWSHQCSSCHNCRGSGTLRSVLTKVKDPLPMEKKAKVVYRIPCSCGKSYIGETKRRLETRLREHQEACRKGTLEKSAVAEHAWKDHHTIKWEETAVVDMARHPRELLLKEAIHIQMTPAEERLNRDAGLELPGCWVAALRRQEGTTNRAGPTPTDRSRANSDCN